MAAKRIMALDPGAKRIGVALSDEMGWTGQPLETIERTTLEADIAHVRALTHRYEVGELIVGLPIRMDGTEGPEAEQARQLIGALEQHLTVPVTPWDERLTTKAAEAILIQADVSRRKRKGAIDRVAAALILQSVLDARSAQTSAGAEPEPETPAAS